jgi:hypothetical protein
MKMNSCAIQGNLHFSVTPGMSLATSKFDVIRIETPSLLVEEVNFIHKMTGDQTELRLLRPTMELVAQLIPLEFAPPVQTKAGYLVMKRPYIRPAPYLLPFIDTTILKRIIVRFGADFFDEAAFEIAWLNVRGTVCPKTRAWECLTAGAQLNMLVRPYVRKREWKATRWVLDSLENDIVDAQAKLAGYDA